jgi:diguanylate cyclase (GGDEF)-like protein
MNRPSESLLGRVSQQLYSLEKRDWELWAVASVTGILVSLGILAIALPSAFSGNDNFHFEVTVPRSLAVGLVVLVALANTYLAARRLEVRRLREEIISNALQKQVIEQQSFTDPLTEIYNRRSLDDIVGRFISQARRRKAPLTFLMVDLDKFKDVNTRFGHLTGDFVLAEAAHLLKGSIRGSDAVVRYGGDEFLILLADTTADGARSVVGRIADHLAEWNAHDHVKDLRLSASIGTAEWHDGQTLDEVLDVADERMYQKKGASAAGA